MYATFQIQQEQTYPPHISVGAFKDRLGANALSIAVSTHPVCIALREMLYDRKFVDLSRSDVRGMLMLLVSNSLPDAIEFFPGSGPLTAQQVDDILTTPIQPLERA